MSVSSSMSMNFGLMKKTVAGYMSRDVDGFGEYGADVLGGAINMARQLAQRVADFEHLRTIASLNVDMVSGTNIAEAKVWGTSNQVIVKKIEAAYVYDDSDPTPFNGIPIPLITRWADRQRMRRFGIATKDATTTRDIPSVGMPNEISLVKHGSIVYLTKPSGVTGTRVIGLDVVAWAPNLTQDTEVDFMLTYAPDYILLKSVQLLNYYLKEDQRVQIAKHAVDESLQAMLMWNNTLTDESDLGTLD